MGHGSFNHAEYRTYATASTLRADGTAKSVHETFVNKQLKQALDPFGVSKRESRDSIDHPESNAIIIALDVTGSMGFIAHKMVKDSLGKLMHGIMETKPVSDPHIMFMGVGDAICDRYPLQVSQFESDIRIAQQLTELVMEGGGGGNNTESYDFPWYFAANHTSIDCFEKRKKKGYLFTIGDELPPNGISKEKIDQFIGDHVQAKLSAQEMLDAAKETYEVFHIIVEEGNYAQRDLRSVVKKWDALMGNRAIRLSNHQYLTEVILATIRIAEGADVETVIEESEGSDVLRHAFLSNSKQVA